MSQERPLQKPSPQELVEGVVDRGLSTMLLATIPKFVYEEGKVWEEQTIPPVMQSIYHPDTLPKSKSHLFGTFARVVTPLLYTGLYEKQLKNQSDRSGTKHFTTYDSMINAVSYLYIKEREDFRRVYALKPSETCLITSRALGENPRSRIFIRASQFLTKHEKSLPEYRNLTREKNERDEDHYYWLKYYPDRYNNERTLQEKLIVFTRQELEDIKAKIGIIQELQKHYNVAKVYDYNYFDMDRSVGDIIEFIRQANSGNFKEEKNEGFDLKEFESGIRIIKGYFDRYPDIQNLNQLFNAVKRTLT